jgi:hypothetical protein
MNRKIITDFQLRTFCFHHSFFPRCMGIDVVEDEDEAKLTLPIHWHQTKLLLWIFRPAKEAKLP